MNALAGIESLEERELGLVKLDMSDDVVGKFGAGWMITAVKQVIGRNLKNIRKPDEQVCIRNR